MMSFSVTTRQFRNRSKTVTRRAGWRTLKPGTVLMGVERTRGLKRGQSVVRLGPIEVVGVRREPLTALLEDLEYGRAEVKAEGFGGMSVRRFVEMFERKMGIPPDQLLTRIQYRYLPWDVVEPPTLFSEGGVR